VAFIGGGLVGLVGGRSYFVVAFLLAVTVLSGVVVALVAAMRAASLTGSDASRSLFDNLHVFAFVASAIIAAFAGYSLSVLLVGGLQ
jgi:L-asparaginase/Glu-tRNA(Gln) amidotransferase subunit D